MPSLPTGVLIAVLAVASHLSAGTVTWTDATHNNQYSDPLNWSPCMCVPNDSSFDVLLPAASPDLNVNISPLISSLSDVNSNVNILSRNSLTLGSLTNGGALNVDSGASLIVSSALNPSGFVTNNGTINLNSGSLILNAAAAVGTFTLTGSGTVALSANAKSLIGGKTGAESLINDVNQTIEGSGTIGNLASFTNNGTLSSQGAHPLIVSATLTNWDGTGLNGGTYIVNQNLQLNNIGSNHINALQQGANVTISGPGILTGDGNTNALAALNAVTDSSLTINTTTSITPSSGTLTISTSGTAGLATASLKLTGANLAVTGSLANSVDDFGNSSTITLSRGTNLRVTGSYTQSTSLNALFGAQATTVIDGGHLTIGGVFTQDINSAITLSHGTHLTANGLDNAGTIILLDRSSAADFRAGSLGTFASLANGTLTGGSYNLSGNLYYDPNTTANGGGLITTLQDASVTLNQGGGMLFGKDGTQAFTNLANIDDSTLSLFRSSAINTITPQGGTLTINGIFSGAQLLLDKTNLTVDGNLSNQSSFPLSGIPEVADLTVQDHGKLTVAGSYTQSDGASTEITTGSMLNAMGFTNGGSLTVDANSTADFRGGAFTNLSRATLTGGSYDIAGTLNYDAPKSSGAITTISGANVTLEGAGEIVFGNGKGTQAFSTLANIKDSSFTLNNATALPVIKPAEGTLALSTDGTQKSSLTLSGTNLTVTGNVTSRGSESTSSSVNVQSGSNLNVSGSFTQTDANTTVDASTLNSGGAFVQKAGSITTIQNAGVITAPGLTNKNSSLFVLDTSVADFRGGAFTNLSAKGKLSGGGLYTVAGQLLFDGGNIVSVASGVSLDLIGQGALLTGTSKANALADLKNNAGVLKLDSDKTGGATLTTSGSFKNTGGTVTINSEGAMTVAGNFSNTNGGVVSLNGPGSSLTVMGSFNNAAGSVMQVGNSFDVDPTFMSRGFTNNGTLFVGQGSSANVQGGKFANLSAGGTLSGGTYAINGTFTYSGGAINTIAANTDVVLNALTSGTQAAILDGKGTDALADLREVAGTLALSGGQSETVAPDGGDLMVDRTGSLLIGAGFGYIDGIGLLGPGDPFGSGTLTIDGGLENQGTVILGSSFNGQSTLTLVDGALDVQDGTYTQDKSATLIIDIDNHFDNTAFSNQQGDVDLAGTLEVNPAAGFMATQGDEFTILTFGTLTGNFDALDFGTFGAGNSLTFREVIDKHDITLEVVSVQSSTPEPSTWFLLGGGLLAAAWLEPRCRPTISGVPIQ